MIYGLDMITCHIFRDPEVSADLLGANFRKRLMESFSMINLNVPSIIHVLQPDDKNCYDKKRKQYKADCLVDYCVKWAEKEKIVEIKKCEICLYLLKDDAYSGDLNFVFGLAKSALGACMVSLYRLDCDEDFILKECIHEIGHVFKLKHCKLPCVMTFSNSVSEAHQKNLTFCDKCQKLLQH